MDELEEGTVCGVDGCAPTGTVQAPSAATMAPSSVIDLSIVSDAICPWCYVGKRRFEQAMAMLGPEIGVRVTWRPFELNPDMPKEGIARSEYRMRKFGSLEYSAQLDAQLAAAGAQDGITFRHDLMLRTPNTLNAHRLIWLASHWDGVQYGLVEILFRAYFCEGRDIGDLGTLADLAAEAGIDRAKVLAFLEGNEGTQEVRRDEGIAQRAGITGVPAFIANGRSLFAGAQRPETIASVLKKIAEETRAPAAV